MATKRYELGRQVQQSPAVRRRMAEVADRIADAAQAVAVEEGVDVEVVRSSGTRPRGRAYERVEVPAVDEHGDSKRRRLRLLARALRR